MGGAGLVPVEGEQEREPGQRRLRPTQRARHPGARAVPQQAAVEHRRVGVADDGVRRHVRAVGEPDTADAAVAGADLRDRGAQVHPHTERLAALQQRVGDPPQPTADVPGPEVLFDVARHRQHRRGAAWVGAGVGGVAVEPGPQPRIGERRGAQAAQAAPRRDEPQVAQAEREPQQVRGPVEGPAQHRVADEVPEPGRAGVQGQPGRACSRSERGIQRGRDRGRVVRQVQRGAVGEAVAARGVHRHHVQSGRAARVREQLLEHVRHRQQRRPGVEGEAVAAELAELAAVGRAALVQLDGVPLRGEPRRHREAADARADDDDLHRSGRPFQVSVRRRCPRHERTSRPSSAATDSGWASASGHTGERRRRAATTRVSVAAA